MAKNQLNIQVFYTSILSEKYQCNDGVFQTETNAAINKCRITDEKKTSFFEDQMKTIS